MFGFLNYVSFRSLIRSFFQFRNLRSSFPLAGVMCCVYLCTSLCAQGKWGGDGGQGIQGCKWIQLILSDSVYMLIHMWGGGRSCIHVYVHLKHAYGYEQCQSKYLNCAHFSFTCTKLKRPMDSGGVINGRYEVGYRWT